MPAIRTILCPIDFSAAVRQELELALEVAQACGSRLLLHHNIPAPPPGLARGWEWKEFHQSEKELTNRVVMNLERLLAEIPAGIEHEARITSGPLMITLDAIVTALAVDLVVVGTHGWSTPDHSSVSERLIDRCPCPVLASQELSPGVRHFRLRPGDGEDRIEVVVASDLTESSDGALRYAFELAQQFPLHLHLLHVGSEALTDVAEARARLEARVPRDLRGRTAVHVETGRPAAGILAKVEELRPSFLVMGEHARGFFRNLFTADTAMQILHRAQVPTWFVPARYGAAD